MKVSITNDNIRFKSILKPNQTLICNKRSFFGLFRDRFNHVFFCLDCVDGFYQLIVALYKSDKPFNITGIDKVQLRGDCISGSVVNGGREPILYSLALSFTPGQIIYEEPKN